jgi:primosomal protein N' (replication factor Y)
MLIAKVLIEHAIDSLDMPFDYLAPSHLVKGVRVKVNFNKQDLVGYVLDVFESPLTNEQYKEINGFELKEIIEVIDEYPILNKELEELAKYLAKETYSPLISCYQTLLPPTLKPTSGKKTGIKILRAVKINGEYDPSSLNVKQKEIYDYIYNSREVLKRDLKQSIASLLKLNKVIEFDKEIYRNPYNFSVEKISGPKLTSSQEQVINEFKTSNDEVYLLEGVTGSGKTEVYINLTEYYLSLNKSVIILVPEISLTPLMIKRFKERLNEDIAVFHSKLTDGEKYDEYRKILNKQVRVVIGVRSAIFAPLTNIGIIILDEEHSSSYKQENTPSYHARMVAIFRTKYYGGKVLLGSATPTLESKARALKGVYHHLTLNQRINQKDMPEVKIVNMIDELKSGNYSLFSRVLKEKIVEKINKKEQVMLLLNRRGYSSYVECKKCHQVVKCPDCDIALTYHKKDQTMKCHYCGYSSHYPEECNKCHNHSFLNVGTGTQKIEESLQKLFPDVRIARMDLDSVGVTKNYDEILSSFENKEYDILLGTQMIAKGLDFSNVTLVGVINADIGLNDHNFRAQELTFQLLTQVAGRSGRGEKEGVAIIQTNNPTNYAIIDASHHDYESFYAKEMEYRKIRKYPPYRYLISLMFKSNSLDAVSLIAEKIKVLINEKHLQDVNVLGPTQPYLYKFNNYYRMKLLVKYKDKNLIAPVIEEVREIIRMNNKIKLTINVDPLNNED